MSSQNTATSGAASIPLGDFAGGDPSGVTAFGAVTGTHPTLGTSYLDGSGGFAAMAGASGMSVWRNSGYRLVLGVPILPGTGDLASGAAGDYDAYFVTLAQNLVADGVSNAILRLGWEFNGNWETWSVANATDAANFAAYWRNIVTAMRSVAGEDFQFIWNPNGSGSTAYTPDEAYPGDAYVDYVGTDIYDNCWCTPQTPQNAWAAQLSQPWGLNWLASFAAEHNKAIGFPEWSDDFRSDGHGLGDDPYFISQFAAWITGNNVAFTCIFSYDDTAGGQNNDITDGQFPNALAAFKADFGSSGPPPTTTTTTASTTTTTAPSTTTTTRAPTTTTTASTTTTTAPSTTTTTRAPTTTTTVDPTTTTTAASTTTTTTSTTTPPGSPQQTTTALSVTSDPASGTWVLTATVAPVPDAGTVQFTVDGTDVGGPVSVSPGDGTATADVALTDGDHSVSAAYSGDASFGSSTVTEAAPVDQAPTALSAASPAPASGPGATAAYAFVLSATLTTAGVPLESAEVWFATASASLCQAVTNATGTATCTVDEGNSDYLGLATTGYAASYEGDVDYMPSAAHSPTAPASVVVPPASPPAQAPSNDVRPSVASGSPAAGGATASTEGSSSGVSSGSILDPGQGHGATAGAGGRRPGSAGKSGRSPSGSGTARGSTGAGTGNALTVRSLAQGTASCRRPSGGGGVVLLMLAFVGLIVAAIAALAHRKVSWAAGRLGVQSLFERRQRPGGM